MRGGKDSIDRYTLIDPDTLALLQTARGDLGLDARIFPYTRSHVYDVVEDAADRTGLLDKAQAAGLSLSPHTIRHAYASQCYAAGMPLDAIRKLLGHSDLKNTLIYVNVTNDLIAAQYARTHAPELFGVHIIVR